MFLHVFTDVFFKVSKAFDEEFNLQHNYNANLDPYFVAIRLAKLNLQVII